MKHRRILNPMAIAREGASKLPHDDVAKVRTANTEALALLRTGHAGDAEMKRLSYALLLADKLREIAPLARDHADTFAAAIDALANITRREESHGHAVATGPELQAIDLALDVHHVQMAHCSRSEFENADAAINAAARTKFPRRAA